MIWSFKKEKKKPTNKELEATLRARLKTSNEILDGYRILESRIEDVLAAAKAMKFREPDEAQKAIVSTMRKLLAQIDTALDNMRQHRDGAVRSGATVTMTWLMDQTIDSKKQTRDIVVRIVNQWEEVLCGGSRDTDPA